MKTRHRQTLGAGQIEAALAKRFASPEYAFMPQLNQGTGSNGGRRADAVAFSLWPSRGLHLSGFEIKVSRSDLATEIKKPEKAEAIQRFCDFWWLVTPAGLTNEMDILPPTWGLMEVTGRGVKVKRQAPKLEPETWTRAFIASTFRAFHETVPYLRANFVCVDDVEGEISKRATEISERERKGTDRQLSELRSAVDAFEKASGIEIRNEWRTAEIGRALRALIHTEGIVDSRYVVNALQGQRDRIAQGLASIDAALSAIVEPQQAVVAKSEGLSL